MKLSVLFLVVFVFNYTLPATHQGEKIQIREDAKKLSELLLDSVVEKMMDKRMFNELHQDELGRKAYKLIRDYSTVSVMGVRNGNEVSYYVATSIGMPEYKEKKDILWDLGFRDGVRGPERKLDYLVEPITGAGLEGIHKTLQSHSTVNPEFKNIHVIDTDKSANWKSTERKNGKIITEEKQAHAEMKLLAFNSQLLGGEIMALGTSKPACGRCHYELLNYQGKNRFPYTEWENKGVSKAKGYIEPNNIQAHQFEIWNVDVNKPLAVSKVINKAKIVKSSQRDKCMEIAGNRKQTTKTKSNQPTKQKKQIQKNYINCNDNLPGSSQGNRFAKAKKIRQRLQQRHGRSRIVQFGFN